MTATRHVHWEGRQPVQAANKGAAAVGFMCMHACMFCKPGVLSSVRLLKNRGLLCADFMFDEPTDVQLPPALNLLRLEAEKVNLSKASPWTWYANRHNSCLMHWWDQKATRQ